jgi:hypothetical protein
VPVGACLVGGHLPRLGESREAVMPAGTRGVGTRRVAVATVRIAGGPNCHRTVRAAGVVVGNHRSVAVSRVPRAVRLVTTVALAAGTPGVTRAGMAVVARRAVSRAVVRRRATADLHNWLMSTGRRFWLALTQVGEA